MRPRRPFSLTSLLSSGARAALNTFHNKNATSERMRVTLGQESIDEGDASRLRKRGREEDRTTSGARNTSKRQKAKANAGEKLHMPGVEPRSQAWGACMMPLHYMCSCRLTYLSPTVALRDCKSRAEGPFLRERERERERERADRPRG